MDQEYEKIVTAMDDYGQYLLTSDLNIERNPIEYMRIGEILVNEYSEKDGNNELYTNTDLSIQRRIEKIQRRIIKIDDDPSIRDEVPHTDTVRNTTQLPEIGTSDLLAIGSPICNLDAIAIRNRTIYELTSSELHDTHMNMPPISSYRESGALLYYQDETGEGLSPSSNDILIAPLYVSSDFSFSAWVREPEDTRRYKKFRGKQTTFESMELQESDISFGFVFYSSGRRIYFPVALMVKTTDSCDLLTPTRLELEVMAHNKNDIVGVLDEIVEASVGNEDDSVRDLRYFDFAGKLDQFLQILSDNYKVLDPQAAMTVKKIQQLRKVISKERYLPENESIIWSVLQSIDQDGSKRRAITFYDAYGNQKTITGYKKSQYPIFINGKEVDGAAYIAVNQEGRDPSDNLFKRTYTFYEGTHDIYGEHSRQFPRFDIIKNELGDIAIRFYDGANTIETRAASREEVSALRQRLLYFNDGLIEEL